MKGIWLGGAEWQGGHGRRQKWPKSCPSVFPAPQIGGVKFLGHAPTHAPLCVCVPVGVCKLMKLNRLYLMVVRTGEKNSLLVTAGRMANILMECRLK